MRLKTVLMSLVSVFIINKLKITLNETLEGYGAIH